MFGDFAEILGPEDLLKKLADLTRPFQGVRTIRLLCQESSPDAIVCVVEANRQSWGLVGAIGGFMYGEMPARTIRPLPAGFRCEGRREGQLIAHFCAKCHTAH